MHKALVSVLTPSFNQGRFIGDCLRSIANQTYDDIEHIVVDGGSSDETLSILNATDRPVRWVSEPDRGQSHALNKALAMSSGEIIGWLNSDDAYYCRDAVASAVAAFEADPELDIVYGNAALVNEENQLLHVIFVPPHAEKLLKLQNFIWQPCVFIRRRSLTSPLLDEALHYGMDRDLWLRLKRGGRKFKKISGVIAIDREYGARKSVSGAAQAQEEWRVLDERYHCIRGSWRKPVIKVLKVLFRWFAIPTLPATSRNHAFPITTGTFLSLGLRQMLLSRVAMGAGRKGGLA